MMVFRYTLRWGGAALVAALPLLVFACSGSSSLPVGTTCGDGTILKSGVCVVDEAGVTPDASATDSATNGDGVAVVDATDALMPDAASDPCPQVGDLMQVNCSSSCVTGSYACAATTCGAFATSSTPTVTVSLPVCTGQWFVFRTPDRPGRDPACAPVCGSDAYAYAISFTVHQSLAGRACPMQLRVDPPWVVLGPISSPQPPGEGNPICHASWNTPTQCSGGEGDFTYVIATDDPNAPARNAVISNVPCR